MNVVELTDRVTQPVEIKETSNGTTVTTINLAVKLDFVKKDEESKPEFIPVTVWIKLAEVCADHLCKGYLVGVTDRLQRRSYDTAEGERPCHSSAITRLSSMVKESASTLHPKNHILTPASRASLQASPKAG